MYNSGPQVLAYFVKFLAFTYVVPFIWNDLFFYTYFHLGNSASSKTIWNVPLLGSLSPQLYNGLGVPTVSLLCVYLLLC